MVWWAIDAVERTAALRCSHLLAGHVVPVLMRSEVHQRHHPPAFLLCARLFSPAAVQCACGRLCRCPPCSSYPILLNVAGPANVAFATLLFLNSHVGRVFALFTPDFYVSVLLLTGSPMRPPSSQRTHTDRGGLGASAGPAPAPVAPRHFAAHIRGRSGLLGWASRPVIPFIHRIPSHTPAFLNAFRIYYPA